MKNYLSNRITKFKDCFSDKKLNEEGAPQGSILGPLFCFLLVKGEMMLYADDTTVSFASAEISTLFRSHRRSQTNK